MNEIERKFLVKDPPSNYVNWPFSKIRQGYLFISDSGNEVRLRQKGDQYFQTIKSGDGLVREEIEIELTRNQFESLWPATSGRRLEKTRYRHEWLKYTIELDVYSSNLEGLYVAEIEFPNEEESHLTTLPDWFDKEITLNSKYKNRNLAQ